MAKHIITETARSMAYRNSSFLTPKLFWNLNEVIPNMSVKYTRGIEKMRLSRNCSRYLENGTT